MRMFLIEPRMVCKLSANVIAFKSGQSTGIVVPAIIFVYLSYIGMVRVR
jgi:hypothetical protein